MQIDPELYKQIKEAIDNFPPYPDLDALIANGDLKKVRGGYNVLSEAGMEAIKKYLISVTAPRNGKPAIFKLSRKRKSSTF
jgi:hypothetical protein